MKKFVKIYLAVLVIGISIIFGLSSANAEGQIEAIIAIDCPRYSLTPSDSVKCIVKATSNVPFNTLLIRANQNISVSPAEGFKIVEKYQCLKCPGCGCDNVYAFVRDESLEGTGVITGTFEISAPETEGEFTPITSIELGISDIETLKKTYTLTNKIISGVVPKFTVVNPVVVDPQVYSLEIDCPKTELKVNESMSCTVKLTTKNVEYNVVVFKSLEFRNITVSGLNGFDGIVSKDSCKKCPGCGCTGKYIFINPNMVSNDGTVELGKMIITAPSTTGAYNVNFSNTIIGQTTYTGFDVNKTEIKNQVVVKSINKVINVVEDTPVEEPTPVAPTPAPQQPTTTYSQSSDNSLSSLSLVSNDKTLPLEFDASRTNYNIKVDSSVSKVTINAKVNNSKASFVSGYEPRTVDLSYGLNTIIIKVQAEDKTIKTYTINITKELDSSSAIINSIVVNGITIQIEENVYDYYVEVGTDVTYSEIQVNLTDNNFLTSFSNTEIEEGNNDVNIRVTDLKNNNINYHITIYKAHKISSSNIVDIIVPVVLIIVSLIIIYMVFKRITSTNTKPKKIYNKRG